jgi:hypothetical protein
MFKFKSVPILAGAAVLVLSVNVATSASASIVSYGPDSPITVAGISGVGTLTFSPDATLIYAVTGTDFNNDFPNQNPSTVASGVQAVFSLSSTPTLEANNESLTNPFTETVSPSNAFNYVAIHNAQGEIIFYFSTLQTSFTLSNSAGALSNARFFDGVAATPLPAALPLFATGVGAIGLLGWRRKRKNATAAIAAA